MRLNMMVAAKMNENIRSTLKSPRMPPKISDDE